MVHIDRFFNYNRIHLKITEHPDVLYMYDIPGKTIYINDAAHMDANIVEVEFSRSLPNLAGPTQRKPSRC